MSVFLLVLKIIGITLLSILAFLLLLILLILFVPIRYNININKPEEGDLSVIAKCTWLLHFINLVIKYTDDLYYVLRVIIIPIVKSDNLKKKSSKDKSSENKKQKNKNNKTDVNSDLDKNKELATSSEGDGSIATTEVQAKDIYDELSGTSGEQLDKSVDDSINDEEQIDKPSLFDKIVIIIKKIIDFVFNIRDKVLAIYKKILDIKDNIEYYLDALNDEKNQAAIKLCLSKLSTVLKHIKPKYIKGNVIYGTDDPYDMGNFLSIYSVLLPIIHDKIQLVPDYEREVMAGELKIKGRITLIVVIWALVKVYFNKDFKRMLKIFKRE